VKRGSKNNRLDQIWSQEFKKKIFIKPPPPIGAGGGYMFSGRPSVRASVRPSVRDSRGSFMFPRYLQYLFTDFRQTLSLVHLGTEMN